MGACVSSSPGTIPLDDIAISIFGLDNAGKTCLLRSLAGDFNFDTVPSIGQNIETFMYDDIKLKVYDLGGSGTFRNVWENFFAEIWGFVYVVDAADSERFEESKNTLNNMISHHMMSGKPYIVVANKQDLNGAVPAAKLRKILGLPKKVKIFDAIVTKVDGDKANQGVQDAISGLIAEILDKYQKLYPRRQKDLEEQRQIEEKRMEEKKKRLEAYKAQREKEEQEQANQQ